MGFIVKDICNIMEEIAPTSLAYEWDNVGLLVGDYDGCVSKIMLALDCNAHTIDECIKAEANMLITHHPIIFSPIKSINSGDITGSLLLRLIKNGINLYSAHTNLDICKFGPNDVVAKLFNYSHMELLDIVEIENCIATEGLGKVIALNEPLSLKDILKIVKEGLQLDAVQYVGNAHATVRRLAILTGSGMSHFKKAKALGADVFLTSDIKYHDAQDALAIGLSLVDITHFHSERAVLSPLMHKMKENFHNEDMEIIICKGERNPFKLY